MFVDIMFHIDGCMTIFLKTCHLLHIILDSLIYITINITDQHAFSFKFTFSLGDPVNITFAWRAEVGGSVTKDVRRWYHFTLLLPCAAQGIKGITQGLVGDVSDLGIHVNRRHGVSVGEIV